MRRIPRLVAATVVGIVVPTATAYAYWAKAGSGSGSGAVATIQPLTVVATTGDTPNTRLIPGAVGEVILKINNPNSFAVTLFSVAGNGAVTSSNGSCAGSSLTFTDALPNFTVPSGTSLHRLVGAATLSSTAASACQNASFQIPVKVTVHK